MSDVERPWEGTILDEATWRMFKAREAKDAAILAASPPVGADGNDLESVHRDLYINWHELFSRTRGQEWLLEPLLPKGRAVAMYAAGGAGKSYLALHLAAALASGRPWSGQAREPVKVLYLDYEMNDDDIADRLDGFGYEKPDGLTKFLYYQAPELGGLDTLQGADALVQLCDDDGIDLVVIDTMARGITGPENENDTYRAVGKYLGMALKRRGITYLRLDHAGKDADRGQRGASAKSDDVDLVWKLEAQTAATLGPTLIREKCRLATIPEKVELKVHDLDGITDFEWVQKATLSLSAVQVVKEMDDLGLAMDVSHRVAMDALRAAGKGRRKQIVLEACRWRKVHLK